MARKLGPAKNRGRRSCSDSCPTTMDMMPISFDATIHHKRIEDGGCYPYSPQPSLICLILRIIPAIQPMTRVKSGKLAGLLMRNGD